MSLTPSTPEYIIPKLKAETIAAIVKKGVRLDGRSLTDYRPITIIPNYLPKAEGSAFVKLGNTQVLVGVKMEVGTPYPDAPNEGVIIVSAEFVPMASPVFEPGPPDENAIELARVIDRSIRETHAIDLEKLAIIPGKKVWTVWIDIYVLDHDGNLMDASSIGTLAALMTAKIPKAEVTEDEQVIVDKTQYVGKLPLRKKVVTVTLGKISNILIVDPDQEEESILDTRIVMAVTEDGLIAGIQKTGQSSITKEEALKAADIAIAKGEELIELITKKVEVPQEKPEVTEEKAAEVIEQRETEEIKELEKKIEEVIENAKEVAKEAQAEKEEAAEAPTLEQEVKEAEETKEAEKTEETEEKEGKKGGPPTAQEEASEEAEESAQEGEEQESRQEKENEQVRESQESKESPEESLKPNQ